MLPDSLASPSDGGTHGGAIWAPSTNGQVSEYLEQDVETNGVQAEKGQTINFSFEQYYQTNLGSTIPTDIQIRIQYGSDINNVIAFQTFSGLSRGPIRFANRISHDSSELQPHRGPVSRF